MAVRCPYREGLVTLVERLYLLALNTFDAETRKALRDAGEAIEMMEAAFSSGRPAQRFVLSIDFDAVDGEAAHRIREHLRDVCERQVFTPSTKAHVSFAVPSAAHQTWPQ